MSYTLGLPNINKSQFLAFAAALVAALGILTVFQTNKASAAWVNQRTFSYAVVSSKCPNTMYASNLSNRPDAWNCFPRNGVTPLPYWIRPGDACKAYYGSSYSFIVTNWNNAYGGFCAQWR